MININETISRQDLESLAGQIPEDARIFKVPYFESALKPMQIAKFELINKDLFKRVVYTPSDLSNLEPEHEFLKELIELQNKYGLHIWSGDYGTIDFRKFNPETEQIDANNLSSDGFKLKTK